ncbi:transcription factor IBH1-like [Humulus lupulus]|uniref:transcription factor IBH1-like n=1 Tax=Humulus lupulus TaxID=3486 RepID=UPI002B40FAED|nr:transcription factor IBH1-like [Humulus lupulus]
MKTHSYRSSYKYRFVQGFIRALKRINSQKQRLVSSWSSCSSPAEISKRYLKVKSAADASMAAAVGPRRAWSRAMLRKIIAKNRGSPDQLIRRRSRSCKKIRRRRSNVKSIMKKRYKNNETDIDNKESFEAMELRKIVPGGEAMDLSNLLEETAHYVKCLATQVKMMEKIVHLYSAA